MRLLHLGDLHIGKTVNDFSMIEDQEYVLKQIIDIAKEKKVDAILIAGDVYDRTVPSEEAVRVFDDFLCALAALKIETFIISGNHDSDERLNFGSSLFEHNGIHIFSKYNGMMYKYKYQDEYGDVNIYLLPFVKASQVKHFFPEAEIENYDDAVRVVIEAAHIEKNERNILVAHQFVAGHREEPRFGGSENVAVQNVGTVERISVDCFQDFDYVALGHIHAPQKIERETIRYAGSPLKYSQREVADTKSVPLIILGEKGNADIELIPLKPLRDTRQLKGTLEQILSKDNVTDQEDYIYATLTDENPIADAMLIMRQHYPNTMKIEYDNSHTKEMKQMDISKVTKERSFSELMSDFYEMMYGCEMDKEESVLMEQIAKEVGIINEAN